MKRRQDPDDELIDEDDRVSLWTPYAFGPLGDPHEDPEAALLRGQHHYPDPVWASEQEDADACDASEADWYLRVSDKELERRYERPPLPVQIVERVEWAHWSGTGSPDRLVWVDTSRSEIDALGRENVWYASLATFGHGFVLGRNVRAMHTLGWARRSRMDPPWAARRDRPHMVSQGRFTLRGDVVILDDAWLRDLGVAGHTVARASIDQLVRRMAALARPVIEEVYAACGQPIPDKDW